MIAFDRARAEESAVRARSQKSRIMARYNTGTGNNPGEEEGKVKSEGNCKQSGTKPIGRSRGWEKESAARARSERVGNLYGYARRISNKPEEEEE